MNKHVEGLRLLADALEASELQGVSFPNHTLNTSVLFRSQEACDAALESLVRAGGYADEAFVRDNTPVMSVTFASEDDAPSGFGGARVTLLVADDGATK